MIFHFIFQWTLEINRKEEKLQREGRWGRWRITLWSRNVRWKLKNSSNYFWRSEKTHTNFNPQKRMKVRALSSSTEGVFVQFNSTTVLVKLFHTKYTTVNLYHRSQWLFEISVGFIRDVQLKFIILFPVLKSYNEYVKSTSSNIEFDWKSVSLLGYLSTFHTISQRGWVVYSLQGFLRGKFYMNYIYYRLAISFFFQWMTV